MSRVPMLAESGGFSATVRFSLPLVYFYNGNILTMNPAEPVVPHMLVSGERLWHCSNAPAPLGLDFRRSDFASTRRRLEMEVRFVDLGGRTVIPGIHDAHVHFLWWALNAAQADLVGTRSKEEVVARLKAHAASLGKEEWVLGFGWSHNSWVDPNLPDRLLLDEAFPGTPVFLSSKCGHLGWANSAALEAAGIGDSTTDPPGGEIERSNGMNAGFVPGQATGILKENAIALVTGKIPPPTEERKLQAFLQGQYKAHALGITSVHNPEDLDAWAFLQRARASGLLNMRFNFWIPVSALDLLADLRVSHGLGDNHLRVSAVKLFSDGSLGGRTALMVEPYEDDHRNFGICVTDEAGICEATRKANRAGLPIAVHAIGDKAVGNVLSAFTTVANELGRCGLKVGGRRIPNRIEHVQVFHPRDIERLWKLRPVASMQPVHLCADMGPADLYWGSRARYAYAFRTIADTGCPLVFGSDAPVESINPFHGMYAATVRNALEDPDGAGWFPQERISIQKTLEAYCRVPAETSGMGGQLGSLQPGMLADFVVLPQNPLEVGPAQLRDLKPQSTWVGGQCVFHAGGEEF